MNRALAATFAIGCIWALTACEDRKPQRESTFSDVVEQKTEAPQSWIRRNDDIDPALWLASKESGRQLTIDVPGVARIQQAFRAGASKFLESDRMVANRTAQLAEMLAKDGKPEAAVDLIEGLSSVVNAERGKETYGELCQFYFTLRHSGADREAALAELRRRYGASTSNNHDGE